MTECDRITATPQVITVTTRSAEESHIAFAGSGSSGMHDGPGVYRPARRAFRGIPVARGADLLTQKSQSSSSVSTALPMT